MRFSEWCILAAAGMGMCWAQKPCSQVPLLAAAWKALPAEQRFPCDAEHVVVVKNYAAFLDEHPELAANAALRERGRHAMAFVISAAWPIYINLDGHQDFVDSYRENPWVAFPMAGMLAHERVHATGEGSEAAGLRAELALDRRFRESGKLPAAFNLILMERQVLEQERSEGLAGVTATQR